MSTAKPTILSVLSSARVVKRRAAANNDNAILGEETPEVTEVQITTFEDPQRPEPSQTDKNTPNNVTSAVEADEHNITRFLNRPEKLDTTAWGSGTPRGGIVKEYKFPQALAKAKWWQAKVVNFTYLKAVVRVSIRANPQPMQRGALMAVFSPQFLDDHQSVTHYSLIPHGKLVCELGDTIQIDLPFIQPYSHIDMTRCEDTVFSILRIINLSPITPDECEISVWAELREVDLVGPNPRSLDPQLMQVGNGHIPIQDMYEIDCKAAQAYHSSHPAWSRPHMQVGNEDKGNVVSGMASQVKGIASAVSSIPVVGAVAEPLAMGASLVEGVAKLFGFSKPLNTGNRPRVRTQYNPYMAQQNGDYDGKKFTLNSGAQLEPKQLFGDDMDEMNLQAIARTPAYVGWFEMDVADASGHELWTNDVGPMQMAQAVGKDQTTIDLAPIAAVAAWFEYWRGGIVYLLEPIKTKFHSGSMQILWTPADPVNSEHSSTMAAKKVCDLRATNGCLFTVPYLQNTAFLKTVTSKGAQCVNGSLKAEVVNRLRNAGDSAPTVEFLVWVAAAEDFTVFAPRYPMINISEGVRALPTELLKAPNPTAVRTAKMQTDGGAYVYQASTFRSDCRKGIFPNPILKAPRVEPQEALMNCSADPVTSIKQLMNRFNWFAKDQPTILDSWIKDNTPAAFFAHCYLFWRGGIRLMALESEAKFVRLNMFPYHPTASISLENTCSPTQIWIPEKEGPLEVELNYYNHRPFARTHLALGGDHAFTTDTVVSADYDNLVYMQMSAPAKEWFFSVADDFQFGFFVGFPTFKISKDPAVDFNPIVGTSLVSALWVEPTLWNVFTSSIKQGSYTLVHEGKRNTVTLQAETILGHLEQNQLHLAAFVKGEVIDPTGGRHPFEFAMDAGGSIHDEAFDGFLNMYATDGSIFGQFVKSKIAWEGVSGTSGYKAVITNGDSSLGHYRLEIPASSIVYNKDWSQGKAAMRALRPFAQYIGEKINISKVFGQQAKREIEYKYSDQETTSTLDRVSGQIFTREISNPHSQAKYTAWCSEEQVDDPVWGEYTARIIGRDEDHFRPYSEFVYKGNLITFRMQSGYLTQRIFGSDQRLLKYSVRQNSTMAFGDVVET